MENENLESQQMELIALESMYEERDFVLQESDPPSGRLMINVRIPEFFHVKAELNNEEESFVVEHLPPITLFFSYPPTYPSESCPAFLLSCNWLTKEQLTILCRHLESLWKDAENVILYNWFQFLQDETLEFLKISEYLDVTVMPKIKQRDRKNSENSTNVVNIQPSVSGGAGVTDLRAISELSDTKMAIRALKDYNEFKKEEVFRQNIHTCDICFIDKIGHDFVILKLCKHFFCKDCLKSYCEVQVKDGNVNSLNCPEGSCKFQIDGSSVKSVVSPDLFERYDKILLQRSLETMLDVSYCPRQDCQCPVLIEPGEKMGSCPACMFVFCSLCKATYHGIAPCKLKAVKRQELYQRYTEGDDSVRENLEKQYGKKVIQNFIDETLSESWVQTNSKQCPKCGVSIEKTMGCNKMTCYKCGRYFCWECNALLNATNPYLHYQDLKSPCYGALFPEDELNQLDIDAEDFLDFD